MISNLRMNRYSDLYYESDDEEYEKRLLKEEEEKYKLKQEKYKLKEEKRKIKDDKNIKQYEIDYAKSIKRTKVYDKIDLCFSTFTYISEIKEDGYNIARYLNLDSFLQHTVDIGELYGLFGKDEYLDIWNCLRINIIFQWNVLNI